MPTDNPIANEFRKLLDGIDHWGSIDSIAHRAQVPEDVVLAVIEAMRDSEISEEICRNAGAQEFLLNLRSRVLNARSQFVWEAIAVVGSCGPSKGKGPNYERIYKDAQRDAQDALEKKFA